MKRKQHLQTLEALQARCVEEGDCWIWQGAHDGKGRPVVVHAGKRISPRRLARQLVDGKPVQPHLKTACRCGQMLCISPDCSVVATNKTVHKMAVERGSYENPARDRRMAMSKRAGSRFGDDAVDAVKAATTAVEGARLTGMSQSHAKAIRAGLARVDYSNPFAGLGG